MNKKRGFTLIEIIICIALIAIIGTTMTFVIINNNKNKQIKTLEKNNKILENALEVYLENHEEIQDNLENNAKGAIVTLEVLKNDGLIDEKQYKGIDLKETYFFLSYSMLSPSTSTDCDNNAVPLSIISSWNVDTDKIVYICPRSDSSSGNSSEEDKSNVINQFANSGYYIARGSNPNNYVKFEVTAGDSEIDYAYFPNDEDKDLWRILSIDENGGIRLIYNKIVNANNAKNYLDYNDSDNKINLIKQQLFNLENSLTQKGYNVVESDRGYCVKNGNVINKCFYPYSIDVINGRAIYNFKIYYKFKQYYNYNIVDMICKFGTKDRSQDCEFTTSFNEYDSLNGFSIMDLYDSSIYEGENLSEDTKLHSLYNNINHKEYVDFIDTNTTYNGSDGIYAINRGVSLKTKFQTLTTDDITNSLLFGKSWLYDYEVISGIYNSLKSISLRGGNTESRNIIDQGTSSCTTGRNATYCYNSSKVYQISTSGYAPVIVLKPNVKLKETKCSKSKIGTKTCPYTLEWVDDVVVDDNAE